ncbi:hypothetical protein MBO_03377 [Moraxella bovoculi 237]|uniref:Uncharacterized protein n=2 Tax=Moraxella TaxID=475 RepID=A0A066UDL4_9GAMM|nr:hypothetical protein [Moraxella bovoculi]KDN25506.1 hypothetical protein MBO_03377 [Moraxella bovoculi 237]
MKKFSILALSATIITAPAFAETTVYQAILSTTPSVELSTQPTQEADLSFAFDDIENLQATDMTLAEMQETEGAVAPLVAIGVIHGGRFIAQRWVTQRVAGAALSKGANIYTRNSQQAKAIANQAWGRQNIIRHGKKGAAL